MPILNLLSLQKQIKTAFKTSAPWRKNIISSDKPEQNSDPQRIDLVNTFANKRWDDLTATDLRPHAWTFNGNMTFETYQYFLPAFMLVSLEPEQVDIRTNTMYSLYPTNGKGVSYFKLFKYNPCVGLKKNQLFALRSFLLYCLEMFPQEDIAFKAEGSLKLYPELKNFS